MLPDNGAFPNPAAVPEALYRSLVWLDVRLGVLFAVALPLVLLLWAQLRREGAVLRLLGLYWKVASLLLIALLLLTDRRPVGYVLLVVATVRIWRWSLTLLSLVSAGFATTALACLGGAGRLPSCPLWLEAPAVLHGGVARVFGFIFGGQWTPAVAAFLGYVALAAYAVGLLQWLLVRLPRQGRIAGEF